MPVQCPKCLDVTMIGDESDADLEVEIAIHMRTVHPDTPLVVEIPDTVVV